MSDVPIDHPVRISTWAQNLSPHHAGTSVEIWAQVFDPITDKLLWQSMALYLSKSFLLPGSPRPQRPKRPAFQPPVMTGQWDLPKDIGRRYGAVSGDRNPIHLSNLTAKALGMPGAIAHGMYAAGKMLAGRETIAPIRGLSNSLRPCAYLLGSHCTTTKYATAYSSPAGMPNTKNCTF